MLNITIQFVDDATAAAITRYSGEPSRRLNAYFLAYRRRLRRELAVSGPQGAASESLIALSSRIMGAVS